MLILRLSPHYVALIIMYSLISSIPNVLYAQDSFKMQIGSLNCTGLACGAITNCNDLPCYMSNRDGDFWVRCKRMCCIQYKPDKIGQVMTVCDYNCTETLVPFFIKTIETYNPLIITVDCAALGALCAIGNAVRRGKAIPIKRTFAYACTGGLCALSWLLSNNNNVDASALYPLGATIAMSAAAEYALQ
jgi:hypothetical protein